MDSQRSFILIGLAAVSFYLWQQWQVAQAPQPSAPTTTVSQSAQTDDVPVPNQDSDVPVVQESDTPTAVARKTGQLIKVTTDELSVLIDTRGGDIVSADLQDFAVTQHSEERYSLLRNDPNRLYIAQSGLIGRDGPDGKASGRANYSAVKTDYQLQGDSLTVPLTWTNDSGLTIVKNFTFTAGKHSVDVSYAVTNNTPDSVELRPYAQLKQAYAGPEKGSMFMPTYRGAAYSTDQNRYEKYDFGDIQESRLNQTSTGGWVAMLEHYFVAAWVPAQAQQIALFSKDNNGLYGTIGYTSELVTIAPDQQQTIESTLYLGPKDQDALQQLAHNLDLTVDYGIFWWISQPLFWLLKALYAFLGNWGLAIIAITIIVKGIIMFPLTKKQYESMGKMRGLQPKMQALKDRYGDDRQKMSQAMMELYKKEKVNPMGGCLPIVIQMPIFLALYYVFLESVELRHAEFYLWIADLSVKDPYYILPLLMGASMFALQKLNPVTVQDPMQQKIMQWMPVAFTVFFIMFPAGLVLYWLVSNLITLVQAKLIYSSMEKRGIAIR